MSKVVKSVAVVDDRPSVRKTFADQIEENLDKMPVIKRHIFSYRENPYADPSLVLPGRQGYLDELNRLKVEIAQAREELRKLGYMLDKEHMEEERARELEAMNERSSIDDARHHARIAQEEAQRLLVETRQNIEAMMQGAQEEGRRMAEEARNNGYLEGFDQGFNQAMGEFKSEHEPQVMELANLLEHISNYRDEQVAQSERELMSLVVTVAEKVIGQEIKTDPRAVVNMMYQTLDANRREDNIRITISPDLMPVEAKASAEIKKLVAQAAPNAVIHVDEDAAHGVCRIETGRGITDLSLDTQLDNIKNMLTES